MTNALANCISSCGHALSGNPILLQDLWYNYDAVRNITSLTNTLASETNTYGYDTLHRLTSWTLNSTPETYTYDPASGNLDVKAGVDLNYNDTAHVHAVTHIGTTQQYWYDQNGNQKKRIVGGQTSALEYDAENRLIRACQDTSSNGICDAGETVIAQFTYDGDGKQVKAVMGTATTYYVGAHYQVENGVVTKYYFAGAQRVAMRTGSTLYYLLGDHLGSTSITTTSSGALVSELRYKPWGEVRYPVNGQNPGPSKYTFTGQREEPALGLYFFNSRWMDPYTGRFIQADSIIPQNQGVQAWDRYAYANNDPVRYTDPSGHCIGLVAALACIAGGLYLWNMGVHLYGALPDFEGIATTVALTDTNDATVAAGISVQSEYPWAIVGGSGKGWAQATWQELMDGEKDPYSSAVAVAVMQERIDNAEKECKSCTTGYDRLIVAAMAQNGPVSGLDSFRKLPMDPQTNTIDWNKLFFDSPDIGNSGDPLAQLRADLRNEQYSTLFMVRLFIHDLRVLMKLGYKLPDGITEDDVKYIEEHFLNHNKDNRR